MFVDLGLFSVQRYQEYLPYSFNQKVVQACDMQPLTHYIHHQELREHHPILQCLIKNCQEESV